MQNRKNPNIAQFKCSLHENESVRFLTKHQIKSIKDARIKRHTIETCGATSPN